MKKRMLLSIDGGGVRGIIPAHVLMKLERVTGKLTRDVVSFVAGTSTGALIAAAIAAGVPAAQLRDLYLNRTKEIFPQRPFNLLRRIIRASMYSTARLHELIAESLGAAREWTLNDAPLELLLTAKRVPDGRAWYFVKDNPRNTRCTGSLRIVDCATASAAAPTYFEPFTMPEPARHASGCEPIGTLVDGGVGVAGNPLYEACVEAFEFSEGYTPESTIAVSLGTGRHTPRTMPTWIFPWLTWILGQLLESPEEQQTEITHRQYPEMSLYRIDIALERDIGLDGAGDMEELDRYGRLLAEQIDWEAILSGKERRFRIAPENTRHEQYAARLA